MFETDLEEMGCGSANRIRLAEQGRRPTGGLSEIGNEQSLSLNGKFLDHRPAEATVQYHHTLFPRVVALPPSSKFPTYQPISLSVQTTTVGGTYIRNTWKILKRGAGEDQLDRSCEKGRSVTKSEGGEEGPTNNKKKESQLDWSHLAQELPSKTRYRMEEGRTAVT